ncbi:MAG: ParB N-terminal domain-containing protein [Oligoflexia bacterium]|nr:ParB N-terminal domain-containing protein [Oligoflexia bacterium]
MFVEENGREEETHAYKACDDVIRYIPVDRIEPYDHQIRITAFADLKEDGEYQALKKAIIQQGRILQPLKVLMISSDGKYQVVSGEGRWRVATEMGLKSVPCIVIKNRREALDISVQENTTTRKLNPIELGRIFQKYFDLGLTREEISSITSYKTQTITKYRPYSQIKECYAKILKKYGVFTVSLLDCICHYHKNDFDEEEIKYEINRAIALDFRKKKREQLLDNTEAGEIAKRCKKDEEHIVPHHRRTIIRVDHDPSCDVSSGIGIGIDKLRGLSHEQLDHMERILKKLIENVHCERELLNSGGIMNDFFSSHIGPKQ